MKKLGILLTTLFSLSLALTSWASENSKTNGEDHKQPTIQKTENTSGNGEQVESSPWWNS